MNRQSEESSPPGQYRELHCCCSLFFMVDEEWRLQLNYSREDLIKCKDADERGSDTEEEEEGADNDPAVSLNPVKRVEEDE
ncbi:hypothetical protein INR49_001780 [Caranx melampygus]|nr:hypothetical protein INR49_001780 [Caranx melampygus]